jgi:hypothetical protein
MHTVARTLIAALAVLVLSAVPFVAVAETVRLEREHGVFMVPVRINDTVTIPFVLDSGAGDVSIPEDVFKTLLRTRTITESDFLAPGTYIIADGSARWSDVSFCTSCAWAAMPSPISSQALPLIKRTHYSGKASSGSCPGGQLIMPSIPS